MERQPTRIDLAGAAAATVLLPCAGHAAAPRKVPDPVPEADTRPCFIEPSQWEWNEALDGPLPRCLVSGSA